MLGRWMHRSGIGQMLAPDPNIKDEEERAETNEYAGGLWSIVAPDPNFCSPEAVSENAKRRSVAVGSGPTSTPPDAQVSDRDLGLGFQTPTAAEKNRSRTENQKASSPTVERLVISAAKDLTHSMLSPPNVWEDHKNFFSYCASNTALNEKKLKKVKKMLRKDPSLISARASNMGNLVPNGFTPLHAAAAVGNLGVAEILIDFEQEHDLNENENEHKHTNPKDESAADTDTKKTTYHPINLDARDVQGRTALHIASVHGHIEIVQLLKQKMTQRHGIEPLGEHAPTDLTGRTPLGWAATSRETRARSHMSQLRDELFSPGDKSVYGRKTPAFMRTGGSSRRSQGQAQVQAFNSESGQETMDLVYGFADMPGHRIEMEDAICHSCPLLLPAEKGECGFFGVFDGHGDGGISSEFVADNIVSYFTSSEEWNANGNEEVGGDETQQSIQTISNALTTACKTADVDLKATLSKGNSVRHGGSTGVIAVITADSIVIGNVGDSRCILVQMCEQSACEAEVSETVKVMEALSVQDASEASTEGATKPSSKNAKNMDDIVVKALSTDHKPELPHEKERIENAGMRVIEETFTIDGVTTTLSKIHKSESDKIAVSRAFGDFDYKANDDLQSEEQAIICTPEITVHSRDHVRDMFLILACDGVFDVMSNDEVGEFVTQKVEELGQDRKPINAEILPEVGDELLNKCLDLGSTDNMSVLIVALKQGGAVMDNATRALNFADV